MLAEGILPVQGKGNQQRVDETDGSCQGIHEGRHIRPGCETGIRHFAQGTHGPVRHGNHLGSAVAGEAHNLHGAGGIAGEGNPDEHIGFMQLQHFLRSVGRSAGHQADMIKHVAKIVDQKLRQGRRAAEADDIDGTGGKNPGHHVFEDRGIQLFEGVVQILHIAFQYGGKNVPGINFRDALKALIGSETVGNQFLQAALELGIPFISQGGSKTDHRAFADADTFAQAGGGHENRFVIMVGDINGNPPMAFAQPPSGVVQPFHHISGVLHPSDPFPSFCPERLYGEAADFARRTKEAFRQIPVQETAGNIAGAVEMRGKRE